MTGRKATHVSSSVGSHCFCSFYIFNCLVGFHTLENHGDKLLPLLADEGTEAQREGSDVSSGWAVADLQQTLQTCLP